MSLGRSSPQVCVRCILASTLIAMICIPVRPDDVSGSPGNLPIVVPGHLARQKQSPFAFCVGRLSEQGTSPSADRASPNGPDIAVVVVVGATGEASHISQNYSICVPEIQSKKPNPVVSRALKAHRGPPRRAVEPCRDFHSPNGGDACVPLPMYTWNYVFNT